VPRELLQLRKLLDAKKIESSFKNDLDINCKRVQPIDSANSIVVIEIHAL
jgi:hypothetical protein